jgi:signal recognition particle subunit SRP54
MGDILSPGRGGARQGRREGSAKLAEKFKKGKDFDLEDFKSQLQQMKKMGGVGEPRRQAARAAHADGAASPELQEKALQAHRGHHQLDDARPSAASPSSSRPRASAASRRARACRCRR